MTDLIERLRTAIAVAGPDSTDGQWATLLAEAMNAADEIASLRERVAELEEALRAITLSGIHRDIKWAEMNAHDIARFALSIQDPEYSGWVEVVDEGGSDNG